MTEQQAKQIREMREQGIGYRSIALTVGLSRDIVRNFCKSRGLSGYGSALTKNIQEQVMLADAGFKLSGCCIWKKNALVLGRSPYQWQHEPCLFGWKKGGKHQWYSDRKQTTIWEYDRPKASKDHPTMKPIALMAYPVQNSSMMGCVVLDPFLGSGSTLMACEQTGRICYGVELEEKFVDVIVNRYMEVKGSADDVFVIRNNVKISYRDLGKVALPESSEN